MTFLYLASPYSAKTDLLRHERFRQAMEATAFMTRKGITVFSPIVHNHEMAKRYSLPTDSEFWMKHNYAMLRGASVLGILELSGWEDSIGVMKEYHYARRLNIPIRQIPYPIEELPVL